MVDLVELFDRFDRLVAAAADIDPEAAEAAGEVARRARRRRGYLGETVVVALAGGTGSGKSSLINALAGEEIALTGPQRPTTGHPQAWIPSNPEPGLTRLLDDMDIVDRVGHDDLSWLAVIDLPDMDSVAEEHRATVERLIPQVDAIVWVVDPEKYQDRLLHDSYLAPLAPHGHRFRFVLNQIDRVDDSDEEALIEDLVGSLLTDGIEDPQVIATAADPAVGPPQRIDQLVESLRSLGEAKDVVSERIVTEVTEAADRLAGELGVEGAGGTGFAASWQRVLEASASHVAADLIGRKARVAIGNRGRQVGRGAVALIKPTRAPMYLEMAAPGEGGPGRRDAVDAIGAHIDELVPLLDGSVKSAVRGIQAAVEDEIADAATVVSVQAEVEPGPPPTWWGFLRGVRWIGAVAVLVAIAVLVDALRTGSALVWPVVALVVGVGLTAVPVALAADSGQRWAEAGFESMRSDVEASVSRELDRRIGRPLRDALRVRAGAAVAFAELRLLLAP